MITSWREFSLMIAILVAPIAAWADEPAGCAAFKWPIALDQAALAAENQPIVSDGGAFRYGVATIVSLGPAAQARFRLPPERPPRPETYGATVELPPPPAPGIDRISLSGAAWIDVLSDGAVQKPLAFSGARDCPHIRKSLKFQFSDRPVTIQISNAARATLSILVQPE